MTDIMKALRGSIDRTTFEAKKFMRLQNEQSQLNRLQDSRKAQMLALGEQTWNLFLAGQSMDQSLQGICEQIETIEQQIVMTERQIDVVKQEQPPAPPKCTQCNQIMSTEDAFCPNCGTAVDLLQLTGPIEPDVIEPPTCPNCDNEIRSGAAFCGSCGTSISR